MRGSRQRNRNSKCSLLAEKFSKIEKSHELIFNPVIKLTFVCFHNEQLHDKHFQFSQNTAFLMNFLGQLPKIISGWLCLNSFHGVDGFAMQSSALFQTKYFSNLSLRKLSAPSTIFLRLSRVRNVCSSAVRA